MRYVFERILFSNNFKLIIQHGHKELQIVVNTYRSLPKDTMFDSVNHFFEQLDIKKQDYLFELLETIILRKPNKKFKVSVGEIETKEKVNTEEDDEETDNTVKEELSFVKYGDIYDLIQCYHEYINMVNTYLIYDEETGELITSEEIITEQLVQDFESTKQYPYPPDLKEVYLFELGRPGTREQTFLKSDYKNLIVLSIIVKLLIPVFVSFITDYKNFKMDVGQQERAINNIIRTTWFEELSGFEKIVTYVTKSKESLGLLFSSQKRTLTGSASDEHIDVLVINLLIKKIGIYDFFDIDPKKNTFVNLCTPIFSYMSAQNSSKAQAKQTIKEKPNSSEEDNSAAVGENYRITHTIDNTLIAIINNHFKSPEKILKHLNVKYEQHVLDEFKTAIARIRHNQILHDVNVIVQFVLNNYYHPESFSFLFIDQLLNAYVAACVYLWYTEDFKFLSFCIASEVDVDDSNLMVLQTGLTKPKRNELEPYELKYQQYQTTAKKSTNLIINPILDMADGINKLNMIPTIHNEQMFEEAFGYPRSQRYIVLPLDTKMLFLKLLDLVDSQ